jgi:hypothetical protein
MNNLATETINTPTLYRRLIKGVFAAKLTKIAGKTRIG